MAKVVPSVPKVKGRIITIVAATLADWAVACEDVEIAAQLEELKPERLGYLPSQEYEWAKLAERWLLARIVSVEHDGPDGPEMPGVCFSSGQND